MKENFNGLVKTLSAKVDREGFKIAHATLILEVEQSECLTVFGKKLTDMLYNDFNCGSDGKFLYSKIYPKVKFGVKLFSIYKEDKEKNEKENVGDFFSEPNIQRVEITKEDRVKIFVKVEFAVEQYMTAFDALANNVGDSLKFVLTDN